MLFRAQVKNDAEKIVEIAVQQAQVAQRGAYAGASARSRQLGTAVKQTEAIEDEDGNVMSLHPFALGVDELGAPDAFLMVQGNEIDYGG